MLVLDGGRWAAAREGRKMKKVMMPVTVVVRGRRAVSPSGETLAAAVTRLAAEADRKKAEMVSRVDAALRAEVSAR